MAVLARGECVYLCNIGQHCAVLQHRPGHSGSVSLCPICYGDRPTSALCHCQWSQPPSLVSFVFKWCGGSCLDWGTDENGWCLKGFLGVNAEGPFLWNHISIVLWKWPLHKKCDCDFTDASLCVPWCPSVSDMSGGHSAQSISHSARGFICFKAP